MTKPKKEPPSLWERSEYDVISETATETELIAVLKTRFSGATVICHSYRYDGNDFSRCSYLKETGSRYRF